MTWARLSRLDSDTSWRKPLETLRHIRLRPERFVSLLENIGPRCVGQRDIALLGVAERGGWHLQQRRIFDSLTSVPCCKEPVPFFLPPR